jgi:hypothetical protein
MKDERSINAVNVAERFGRGEATEQELRDAADAAYYAADAAYYATDAAYYAADAASAAADAAYYAADAAADAYAASAAAYAYAASAAAYAYAKKENQKQTADICKEILGELIINKVNELLNQTK